MKLHEHGTARMHLIGRYGDGAIEINGQRYTRPLMVAPAFLQPQWIDSSSDLAEPALAPLWPHEPRIVLLGGSGWPPAQLRALRQSLATRQIALEVMDLGAACRTYNVLAQEDRAVAALLFPA
jgi:uncharacterized protein